MFCADVQAPCVFPLTLPQATLGEFGATITFAGNFPGRTQTMPLAIYIGFEIDLNIALTLSAIVLVIAFAALLLIKATLRRRVEVTL
jgi:molybdate transport system permease protein